MTTAPNTGLTFQNANSMRTDELYAELINYLDTWLNCSVLAVGQAAPIGTEVDGDRYIIGTGTGLFVGHNGKLAIKFSGTWFFFAPPTAGVPIVKNLDDGTDWENVGGVWAAKAGGAGGSTTITLVTEASAFTATPGSHASVQTLILAGGDATFDTAEGYDAGEAYNIRATSAIALVEDGVTLTPPAGGTLALDAEMSVTVIMTSGTAGIVMGQTVPL